MLSSEESSQSFLMVDEHYDSGVSLINLKAEKVPSRSLTMNKGQVFFTFEDKEIFTVSPKSIQNHSAALFTEQIVI